MAVDMTVIEEFADRLGLTSRHLTMQNRNSTVAKARFMLYKLLRDKTNLTYADIGLMINRKRVSVRHGVIKANKLLEANDSEAVYMWNTVKDIDIERENQEVVSIHKYNSSWIIRVSHTVRNESRDIYVSNSVMDQLKQLL